MDAIYKAVSNYEEISTCYHEAGHVIYALLSHSKVEKVEFLPPNEGNVYYDIPEYWNTNNKTKQLLLIKKEVSIRYAGLLAEQILYESLHGKTKLPAYLKIGSSSDFKDVSTLLNKYGVKAPGLERKKYKNKIKQKVFNDLKNNWTAIAIVANILFSNKEIKYNNLKKVLTKNSKKWDLIFKKIETF